MYMGLFYPHIARIVLYCEPALGVFESKCIHVLWFSCQLHSCHWLLIYVLHSLLASGPQTYNLPPAGVPPGGPPPGQSLYSYDEVGN